MVRSLRDIEDQLAEAAFTLRCLPDRTRPKEYGNNWPDIVRESIEAYGWEDERSRSPVPSAEAIDRMHEALPWLGLLDKQTQKLVWLRANGVAWWQLQLRLWRFPKSRRKQQYSERGLRHHFDRGLRLIQVGQA